MGKILINAKEQNVYNILGDGKTSKGYVLRPARYSTIGGEEIVDECARLAMVPKSYVAATLEALAIIAPTFLSKGHSVTLPNLGTLSITANSKAVANIEDVDLDKLLDLNIRFRPSHTLREEIDKVSFEIGAIYQIAGEEVLEVDDEGKPTKTRKIYRDLNKSEALKLKNDDNKADSGNTDSGNDTEQEEPGNGGNTNPGSGTGGGGDLEG